MKILFYSIRFHTNQFYLIRELVENGYKVEIYSNESKFSENHEIVKPTITGFSKLTKFKTEKNKLRFGIMPFTYILKSIKTRPDVIILKGFSPQNLVLKWLYNIFSIKVITSVQKPKFGNYNLKNKLYWRLFGENVTTVSINKECSNSIEEKMGWEYLPFSIYPQIEKRNYLKGGGIRILCVAKFTDRKNILDVVEAFLKLEKKFDNIKLTVCGTVLDQLYYEKVMSVVQKSKNIEVLIDVPHSKMKQQYLKSDIFILASRNEAASFSQLEAMSFGLPVLINCDNGTGNYVKHNSNGFVLNNHNLKENLERYLEKILKNNRLLERMGDKSLEIVRENHSYKNFTNYLERIIR